MIYIQCHVKFSCYQHRKEHHRKSNRACRIGDLEGFGLSCPLHPADVIPFNSSGLAHEEMAVLTFLLLPPSKGGRSLIQIPLGIQLSSQALHVQSLLPRGKDVITRDSPTAVPVQQHGHSPEIRTRKAAPETQQGQAERNCTTAGAAMLRWVKRPILLVSLPIG